MSANTGGPAFPQHVAPAYRQEPEIWGMTLRDYFAAKAMASIILKLPPMNNYTNKEGEIFGIPDNHIKAAMDAAAWGAYNYADAMLARRDK